MEEFIESIYKLLYSHVPTHNMIIDLRLKSLNIFNNFIKVLKTVRKGSLIRELNIDL
jgi:hypothetical protein